MRTRAENFAIEFLRYVRKNDILDQYNPRTQKMQRSAGLQSLINLAESVFPPAVENPSEENSKLTETEVTEAVQDPNVVDARDLFARKVAANGGARGLLKAVLAGDPEASEMAEKFLAAHNDD